MGPNLMTGVLYEESKVWTVTQRRRVKRSLCDDGGRHWSDAAASQRTPRIADHNQKLNKQGRILPKAIRVSTALPAP